MGNLSVDGLAIGALAGFATLVALSLGIGIWFWKKAMTPPSPPAIPTQETSPDA